MGGNIDINTCKCDEANGYKFITEIGVYQYQCAIDCTNVANSLGTRYDRTTCDCKDTTYIFITS